MYCIKCGKKLGEESNFCGSCGQKVQRLINDEEVVVKDTPVVEVEKVPVEKVEEVKVANVQEEVTNNVQFAQPVNIPNNKVASNKKINAIIGVGIGAVIVALLAIVLLVVVNMNKSGYKDYNDLVEDYFEAFEDNEPKLLKSMLHENMLKEVGTEEEIDAKLQYLVSSIRSEYNNKLSIAHRVSEEELDMYDIEYYKRDLVEEYGFDKKEIEDVKELDVEFIVNGDEESEYFTVAKINGRWYLISDLM